MQLALYFSVPSTLAPMIAAQLTLQFVVIPSSQ